MEIREQLPTITEVRNLELVGFSSEEIACLYRIKTLYLQGSIHEATPEVKRLAFVHWLYFQTRGQPLYQVETLKCLRAQDHNPLASKKRLLGAGTLDRAAGADTGG